MTFSTPLLLGHRGSPRQAKENTLESFRLALEAGLDGLELDLHRTRDGVLAVYHDFEFEGRPINELDWPALQRLAPWMPRLEQVFELAEQFPKARLNLELKSQPGPSDGREAALAQALLAWPHRERAWISSFDPLALIRLHRLKVDVPLALLYAEPEMEELMPCLPVQGVHPYFALLSQSGVAELKARGLFIVTWTVNQAAVARELLAWGVDGIIGDLPTELLAGGR
ncbi:glycerophosphodiester phosphodiesterase [Meiothermus hypogaeus]|uniref:Glycerophosphoryl diester phosphodiesterase n=2 Tax=Meiothermus hypogaeus TaxID=884155 RepID=A0A511R2F5_9DEIN|nr:glycerophosphodiester phosphodiesterase [Meiothermus hypogaeus]RIH74892.1 Glycerophosphodiester phosphodiesterase, cytoplasmic [Meiothermus hypogaeus]GEM83800.1 glycerophosphoryl diester phosphodiesterase [Meiothermus hypogaeus NBRC 106114]GIW36245.1 MAG: glycerophosphoryl diester phosphodiesterase [Meiothermus sp.]